MTWRYGQGERENCWRAVTKGLNFAESIKLSRRSAFGPNRGLQCDSISISCAVQLNDLLFGVFQALEVFLKVGPFIMILINGGQFALVRFPEETQGRRNP